MGASAPFRILAVCTGNVCRSPMVESLLQTGLDSTSSGCFEVRSAGTQALVGHEMTPQIAGLARVLGADYPDFTSRQLTSDILLEQNLVLALTTKHRSRILDLAPALLRRTFTLREFGRMVNSLASRDALFLKAKTNPYERWEQMLPLAASVRHEVLTSSPTDNDVVDPYRRDDSVHREMVSQIYPAVRSLIDFERMATAM